MHSPGTHSHADASEEREGDSAPRTKQVKSTGNFPCVNVNTSFVHRTSTVTSRAKEAFVFMALSRDGKGEGLYATKLFSLLLCKVEMSIQGH